jgi:hypothetical protein
MAENDNNNHRMRTGLLLAGLTLCGALSGCGARSSAPADPVQPTTPSTSVTAVPWLIDHLESDENGIQPWGAKYIAFCARADAYTPSHVPDENDLVAVQITKADLALLIPSEPCPIDPTDMP